MSWNRKARASKTKAAANISAMAGCQPLSPVPKLHLKFKRDVWNSYTPVSSLAASAVASVPAPDKLDPSPKSRAAAAGQKRKRKSSPVHTGDEPVAKAPKCSPVSQQCKIKLIRFHYGGPERRVGGKHRDTITLEQPCLRKTCANCWKYHPHLMRNNASPVEEYAKSPTASPITVRSSSNSGEPTPAQESQRSSVNKPSPPPNDGEEAHPKLTLKLRFNTATPSPSTAESAESAEKYNILLPNTVSKHTSPTAASPSTVWCETLRQSYTVRLKFTSDEGKERYKDLVHKQTRRELHIERLRLDQNKCDVIAEAHRKSRRRHRVRLVFASEEGREGREKFRRLMEKYRR